MFMVIASSKTLVSAGCYYLDYRYLIYFIDAGNILSTVSAMFLKGAATLLVLAVPSRYFLDYRANISANCCSIPQCNL